jgi:hypothetical protein
MKIPFSNKIRIPLVLGLCFFIAAKWFPAVLFIFAQGAPARSCLEKGKHAEALDWLRANKNPAAFASNRFGATKNAILFVEALYAKGAERVYILDPQEDPQTLKLEGGPYADTLIVILPKSFHKQNEILKIKAKEVFFDPTALSGNELFFWWD